MYIEGGDQYRGWFQSSLLIGVGLRGESPYRQAATGGWALDTEGKAMSKSLGNSIEPAEVVDKYGADMLRLWVSSIEFTEDFRMGDVILQRMSDAYRKLRNTFRYALGNLSDFDPAADAVDPSEMLEIDQWILARAEELIRKCRAWYDDFDFHKVYRAVYDFATIDLSAIYFDVLKDRLYTAAKKSPERRSAQTAVWRLTYALVRLLAPILVFTTEEVWGYFSKPAGAPDSVHLALLPAPEEVTSGLPAQARERLQNWDRLLPIRDEVLKSLEAARNEKLIGAPLEARIRLTANGNVYPLLEQYAAELPSLFIVSQVTLENGSTEQVEVKVARAEGRKCERCWKYRTEVGTDPEFPTICNDCKQALLQQVS
jgi:isoleucyl-tRNA synthetase